MYSADLPLSRQRLESGKAAEYTRRIINIYITKKSCDKLFVYSLTGVDFEFPEAAVVLQA